MDRFWAKVDKTGECWVWTAAKDPRGYGRIRVGGRTLLAHRFAYELLTGEKIPPGEESLHNCDNPSCVRWDSRHIVLGTHAQNMQDASHHGLLKVSVTHCPQGHQYNQSNTRYYYYQGSTRRYCRACENIRSHEKYRRRKGQV